MASSHGGGAFLATFVVLVSLVCVRHADTDPNPVNTCTSSPTSATHRLRHQLFCNYEKKERPTKNIKNATQIGLHQMLLSIFLDEHKNIIEINSWMTWEWKDEYLNWNKANFEDIETIIVTNEDIWVPDISVYDLAGKVDYQLNDVRCHLNWTGDVSCTSPSTFTALCNVDIEEWPYDQHDCAITLGPWSYSGEELNLTVLRDGISTVNYAPNRDWKLLNSTAKVVTFDYQNVSYIWAEFLYELKSYNGGHAAIIVPALVLAAVTLAAYATETASRDRLAIISLNVITHIFFLTFLGNALIHNGELTPYIVLFYRDSLVLAALSMVSTIISRKLIVASTSPPPWVLTLSSCLLTSFPAQILLFDEHKEENIAKVDDVDSERPDTDAWRLIGILLDRVTFVIIVLNIGILAAVYIA